MTKPDPQSLISEIRYATGVNRWLNGDCYRLYLILKAAFPQAVAYYDGGHVYTEIDGCYYDIRGYYGGDTERLYPIDREPRIARDAIEWRSDEFKKGHALEVGA